MLKAEFVDSNNSNSYVIGTGKYFSVKQPRSSRHQNYNLNFILEVIGKESKAKNNSRLSAIRHGRQEVINHLKSQNISVSKREMKRLSHAEMRVFNSRLYCSYQIPEIVNAIKHLVQGIDIVRDRYLSLHHFEEDEKLHCTAFFIPEHRTACFRAHELIEDAQKEGKNFRGKKDAIWKLEELYLELLQDNTICH